MIVFVLFPISDSRAFLDFPTEKIPVPVWPAPSAYDEFVRSYGKVKPRSKGGLGGWLLEDRICNAHRAIRIPTLAPYFWKSGKGAEFQRIGLKCSSRHFYFDGLAVGKLEAVFVTKKQIYTLPKARFHDFIDHVLDIPFSIHYPDGNAKSTILFNVPYHISKQYLQATTHRKSFKMVSDTGWVQPGAPLVFIVCGPKENVGMPNPHHSVPIPRDYGISLKHFWHQRKKRFLRIWVSREHNRTTKTVQKSRTLRLYLTRLHAEHECLRLILKNIANGTISVIKDTPEDSLLQYYLNEATSRITSTNKESEKKFATCDIAEMARLSDDYISPGQRDSLLQTLEIIRPQIFKKIREYSGKELMEAREEPSSFFPQWVPTSGSTIVVKTDTANFTGGISMGDTNTNVNYGNVGAQGSNPRADHFTQSSQQSGITFDLKSLHDELAALVIELNKRASEPEHYVATGAVAEAQIEAKKGDQSNVLQKLAKAGRWAFDVARDISVNVAAEAISRAILITP